MKGGSERIEALPRPENIIKRQQANGSWRYKGGSPHIRSKEDYDQIETFRVLGIPAEKFGLTIEDQTVQRGCDYLLGFQKEKGDIRGIYGSQFSPNYTAAMLELMVRSGYQGRRIEKAFEWLLSMRQNDGGWAIPLRTRETKPIEAMKLVKPLYPDPSKPSSHLVTGMVFLGPSHLTRPIDPIRRWRRRGHGSWDASFDRIPIRIEEIQVTGQVSPFRSGSLICSPPWIPFRASGSI